MSKTNPRDIAASVRQRLTNLAHQRKEDFQLVLSRYAVERLMFRISQSGHGDGFVIKGAVLFALWTDAPYRPTRDIDLLGRGDSTVHHLEDFFRDICEQAVEDDGLVFLPQSVTGTVIKPDQEYEGVRVQFEATLERARIPVQIDIGFGDVITPGTQTIQYPSMLGFPTPLVFTYPRETVVAEKLQAMVLLGMANSRMKDFFDLWVLAERFAFDGGVLVQAVQATFERRRTLLPEAIPTALTDTFHQDESKQKQWKAFISKGGLTETPSMPSIMAVLRNFLLPLIEAASSNEPLRKQWTPGGPWRHSDGET